MGQIKTLAKYKDDNGREIVLTDVDLVRVISDNPAVTQREMKLFVELCKALKSERIPFISPPSAPEKQPRQTTSW